MIEKIKTFSKKIDLSKMKKFNLIALMFLLTALMLTFLNDVIINYWYIVISVFIPLFLILLISFILCRFLLKNKSKEKIEVEKQKEQHE